MNDPRGSTWRKWDLHVHTPESLVHQYQGADPWTKFLNELEHLPAEFKVIGVNDYMFLDGYKRILDEKEKGRLANIELFLPVIELRLDKFGGSQGHLSRVNYHVIFSNDLTPDIIEQQFLNALSSKYVLSPQYDQFRTTGKWQALPTKQSLLDLGNLIINSVPLKERAKFSSPLLEGFNNLCLNLESIKEALQSHYFENKFVTAVGKTEWADIKWNDHSIADKKTIINSAHLIFISAESAEACQKAKIALTEAGVNDRLLDCSDAHSFSDSVYKDRIGQCLTWIKADPTFEGLRQVLHEPDERVFIGELPSQLGRVRANSTKFIRSLRIERKPTSTISEIWFDNTIPLNPALVAIIGNKGKGKSALTDIIGLTCNTKQHGDFTFLSTDNFRQPKDNKAKHFQATVTWESGTTVSKGLDEDVDERQPELVKYIPQNFLEKICTQLGSIEESDFDRELKKVIFSHVDSAQRLGRPTLDELVLYKTTEANARIQFLKRELARINQEVVVLEEKGQPEHRESIENLLAIKGRELEAHENTKPSIVTKPENDPKRQKELSEIDSALALTKEQLAQAEKIIADTVQERITLAQALATIEMLLARLDNLQQQVQTFASESKADLAVVGISLKDILTFSVDKQPLTDRQKVVAEQKLQDDEQLSSSNAAGLINKKRGIEERLEQLQTKLDEPNKKYQAYEAILKAWEIQREAIVGNETMVGTIKYLEQQLTDLNDVPGQLGDARSRQFTKAKEIHAVIRQLADTYRELYAPVHEFIKMRTLAKEKFHLNFEVAIVDTGFQQGFFEIVSQGITGTFCGVEQGTQTLSAILARNDFTTEVGVEAFLTEILDSLHHDQRPGGGTVRVKDQIRRGKKATALYDLVFSLDYLKPRYALRMGDKELHQLSPGERGTLLLVFYLLLDKDDIPLVIDQPEENLDNQTVYELLVPCMKEAKQRRQVFIVTHNPNLAVVCDAEQIIRADLDKKAGCQMNYLYGAIENPEINKAIVDILEGTMPAFANRDSKYL
jgi:ABC-type lipoprotein export system ATPase subunit